MRTVRPAGQSNTAQTVAFDFFDRGIRRQELAVNPCFTHSACNELVILRSEIDDYDFSPWQYSLYKPFCCKQDVVSAN